MSFLRLHPHNSLYTQSRGLRSAIGSSSTSAPYRSGYSLRPTACQCTCSGSRRWASTSTSAAKALPNHYAVLGLRQCATPIEINRSVKATLAKYHPDRHRLKSADKQAHMRSCFDEAMRAANVLQSQAEKMAYDVERARESASRLRVRKKRKSLKPEPIKATKATTPSQKASVSTVEQANAVPPSAATSASNTTTTSANSASDDLQTAPPSKPPPPRVFPSSKVSASLWSAARATVVNRTQLPLALPPSQLLESRHQIATTYPQYASLLDVLSNPRMARWRGDTLQLERSSSSNALVPLDGRSKYEKRLNEARGTSIVIMVVDQLPDDTTMRAKGWKAFRGFNSRTQDGHLLHVRIYHGKGDTRARLSAPKAEDKLWLASKNLPSGGRKTSLWLWAVDQAARQLSV